MVTAMRHEEVKISLVLTAREAEYLHDLVQNYLGPDAAELEPQGEKEIRENLFAALHQVMYP